MSACPLSKSANRFAIELFQVYMRRHGEKYRNLLLCPYLIYHSLAMMLVGARGNTAKQLTKVLNLPREMRGTEPCGSLSSSSSPLSSQDEAYKSTTKGSSTKRTPELRRPTSSSSYSSYSSNSSLNSDLVSNIPSTSTPKRNLRPRSKSSNRRSRKDSKDSVKFTNEASQPKPDEIRSDERRKSRRLISAEGSLGKSLRSKTGGPDEARHREFLLLTEQLLHGNHDFIHLASFIYLDKGVKRAEKFKAVLRDFYETKPKKVDFENVDTLVKTVNEDVSRTTEHIYSDILSRQEAQSLEKSMLLVNAVFFRGFWLSNFSDVRQAPFNKVQRQFTVNMMSKLDYLPLTCDQDLDARIIMMPFEASDLQMMIVLPNDRSSDSTYLCEKLTGPKIESVVDDMNKAKFRPTKVTMPVFCIDSGKISIQSTLITMGAGDLFDPKKADMSGSSENKQVWLNKILHRCFIICDNRGSITSLGSEKAKRRQARLLSGVSTSKTRIEEFTTDHPFMYLILDSLTGTILLMGLYTDPSEALEVIHESQLNAEDAHSILTEGIYKT